MSKHTGLFTRGWLRALWAGLLSLFQPGLGQVYAGSWRLGILLYVAIFGVGIVGIAFTWMVPPTPKNAVMLVAALAIWAALRLTVAVEATIRVRRHGHRTGRPWHQSTWVAAIIMIAVSIGSTLNVVPGSKPGWWSYSIMSSSIMPTLMLGDRVLADIRHPGVMPTYGDMVIFQHPQRRQIEYIKRVIGLPGDRIQLRQSVLYLNGRPVPRASAGNFETPGGRPSARFTRYRETLPNGRTYFTLEWTDDAPADNTDEFIVPPGGFFVLGDNRDDSLDSRHFGYVPIANMIGIAQTVYWTHDLSRLFSRID